ncbi:putative Vacuolar protein sorting-associated protein 20-like protein 1 [Nannochloris sp. 'desiccata']|nr:hypothetical protein KSW81_004061 [Chlorella desiccata (nom. nud.)]KAH7624568.1 putative Vacuolar protein sorting-associated protein 20-like protein 1 [Chlorella desiccata (nom. nud.)]
MGNIISNKPKLEITEVDRAVLGLKTQRHRLEDHRTRVTAQIGRETLVARQLIASEHKDRALLALKKKKLQENTLLKLDAFLLNLADVESSKDQVKVFAALKQGNEAQKLLQKAVALEDVEELMEETAEAREYQDQLQRALGVSWTGQDESEIEAELAALEMEVAGAELPAVPAAVVIEKKEEALPSVPTHKPTAVPAARQQENEPQPLLAS